MLRTCFCSTVSCALLFLHATAIGAAPNIDAYAEASRAERPVALATAHQELKLLAKYKGADKPALQKELRDRIAALENPLEPYYATGQFIWKELRSDGIGRVDASESLANRLNPLYEPPTLQVFQVIDKQSALLKRPHSESLIGNGLIAVTGEAFFIVQGISTEDWVDGRDVQLHGVFAVIGTKTYDTADATRTVPLVEKLDLSKHADKFTRKHDSRTWTTSKRTTTEAIFVRYNRGKVTLMNASGKSTDVALDNLSDADRDYVRKKIAELKPRK